jgi:hypothetical protein
MIAFKNLTKDLTAAKLRLLFEIAKLFGRKLP